MLFRSKVSARYLDRTTQKEKTVSAGGDSSSLPAFEDRQLYPSQAEAQKAADSKLQSLRAGEVRVSITMPGRPELNAEGLISLKGFRPEVDGEWNVRSITHDLSSSGYTTSVECGTQGDENDGWATGSGANDGLPPSRKASAIGSAAARARGMNTRGGPDGGNNACVYAVNKVLRKIGRAHV